MTVEEMKNLLLSGEEEGADRSVIYDKVVGAYADIFAKAEESDGKITELTTKTAELASNNLKLLEKIRYSAEVTGQKQEEPDPEEHEKISIEQLLKEIDDSYRKANEK